MTQPWPVARLRDEQRRLWQQQTADELDLGWDLGRVIIPIRDAGGGVQGVLRYAPRRTRAPKMLAMAGTRLGLIPRPDQHPAAWYLLAEGLPDMITGRSRGLPVIAIPGDHAWDPSWADQFAGERVTVVMDCDRQGREAAARIAADLKATAAAVAIADLDPNRDDGYDLTDWLDQNRMSVRALHTLFEPTAAVSPPEQIGNGRRLPGGGTVAAPLPMMAPWRAPGGRGSGPRARRGPTLLRRA